MSITDQQFSVLCRQTNTDSKQKQCLLHSAQLVCR